MINICVYMHPRVTPGMDAYRHSCPLPPALLSLVYYSALTTCRPACHQALWTETYHPPTTQTFSVSILSVSAWLPALARLALLTVNMPRTQPGMNGPIPAPCHMVFTQWDLFLPSPTSPVEP